MSASRHRRRSGPVAPLPGLFGALVVGGLAAAAAPLAAQPPGQPSGRAPTEPGVLEFTISDLDDDHLDFLTGWDRNDGDLLEAFSRGTARFHLSVGFAPILPELTSSRWVWFAGATAPARPPSEAVSRPPRRRRAPAGGPAGRTTGGMAGARPRSGSPPRARFPEPRPGARPFPAGRFRPPPPGTRAPSGPSGSSGRAGAPGPRRPRPTAAGAGSRPGGSGPGRAVPRRTGGPRRSR